MSKSKGNVVEPHAILDKFGLEAVKYYLLRESTLGTDGDYSDVQLMNRFNSEVVDTYGNLISRIFSPKLNGVEWPKLTGTPNEVDQALISKWNSLALELPPLFEKCEFNKAIFLIFDALRATNKYLAEEKPWVLKKETSEEKKERLEMVLFIGAEAVRISSIHLQSILPTATQKVLDLMNVPVSQRNPMVHAQFGYEYSGATPRENVVLFPKIVV